MTVFLRARHWLREGILPNGGGWLAQSAKLVKALEVIVTEERLVASELRAR